MMKSSIFAAGRLLGALAWALLATTARGGIDRIDNGLG